MTKSITISFDEWNVWHQRRFQADQKQWAADEWPIAPRLLEDVYPPPRPTIPRPVG